MEGSKRLVFQFCKQLHTLTRTSPSNAFKNPKRNRLFVETPESLSWLDTASMPMFATVAGIALFAKLPMMEDVKDWSIDVLTDALTGLKNVSNGDRSRLNSQTTRSR